MTALVLRSFYQHLFETEPTVQPLFRNSLKSQGRALVKMINAAVTVRPLSMRSHAAPDGHA